METDNRLIPGWVLALLLLAVIAGMLALAGGDPSAPGSGLIVAIREGWIAAMIFIAAGGYGWAALRTLLPSSAPHALRLATACGFGLWLLSTVMLTVGTFAGLLTGWLWWPIVAGGVALAASQGGARLRNARLPSRLPIASLLWLTAAAAIGLALAGAMLPPELIRTVDIYDVLEYHLQVPREFYDAGRITSLPHNCYSFYPLGAEMLYLLAMCLRGGPYAGAYAATLLHGAFAVLAVAALWATLRPDRPIRARAAALLLATAPLAVSLAWLAMVELAMVAYMAMAALWLRYWLRDGGWRPAGAIGLMLGASCAVKYLSVGFIVAPVAAVMLIAPLLRRRWRNLAHLPLVAALTLLLFAPWLIRNNAYTGNAVFPLATDILGRGYWPQESAHRWQAGHGPDFAPPVPQPPGWEAPPQSGRCDMLWSNFILNPQFALLIPLALAGLLASVRYGRRIDAWDASLGAILLVQVSMWAAITHGMPPRFLAPALVPLALLGGGAIRRLTGRPDGPLWRRLGAGLALLGVLGGNLYVALDEYRTRTPHAAGLHGAPYDAFTVPSLIRASAGVDIDDDARTLLVGEVKAFYWPSGAVYATAFDVNPLAEWARSGASGEEMIAELRRSSVKYVFVNWREILRLAHTYGFPASLSSELFRRIEQRRRPGLDVLDRLQVAGMRKVTDLTPLINAAARQQPDAAPLPWPNATLYALPELTATTQQSE